MPRSRSRRRSSSRGRYSRSRSNGRRSSYRDAKPTVSLLVRNVSYNTRPEELKREFSSFGDIRDVYIPTDYHTREPRGFAFIEFFDKRDAQDARDRMHGYRFHGRELSITFAKERRKNPDQMRRLEKVRKSTSRSRSRGRSNSASSRSRSRSRRRSRSSSSPRRTERDRDSNRTKHRSDEQTNNGNHREQYRKSSRSHSSSHSAHNGDRNEEPKRSHDNDVPMDEDHTRNEKPTSERRKRSSPPSSASRSRSHSSR